MLDNGLQGFTGSHLADLMVEKRHQVHETVYGDAQHRSLRVQDSAGG